MRAFELPALIVTLVGGPLLIRAYIMHEGDGVSISRGKYTERSKPTEWQSGLSEHRLFGFLRESWFRDLNGYYDKYMLENVAYQKGLMTYWGIRNKGHKSHRDDIDRDISEGKKLQVQNYYHYFLNPLWTIYSYLNLRQGYFFIFLNLFIITKKNIY